MRVNALVLSVLLAIPGLAAAQEWEEYVSLQDGFRLNFPGQPTVRDITYQTEYGITLPARIHIHEAGASRYSVTVVDYSNVEKIHAERLKGCKAYPNLCTNPFVGELRGAMDFAVLPFLQRDAKVTHYAYAITDRVEGRRIQLLNPDRSRTFVAIYMHETKRNFAGILQCNFSGMKIDMVHR